MRARNGPFTPCALSVCLPSATPNLPSSRPNRQSPLCGRPRQCGGIWATAGLVLQLCDPHNLEELPIEKIEFALAALLGISCNTSQRSTIFLVFSAENVDNCDPAFFPAEEPCAHVAPRNPRRHTRASFRCAIRAYFLASISQASETVRSGPQHAVVLAAYWSKKSTS